MSWSEPTGPWKFYDPSWESDELDPERRSGMWNGHRWFVYDLLRWRKPDVVVELGTHYGPSIFAMAQAVKDAGLNTQLNAVDTWEGEEHAGFYGEEVLGIVKHVKKERYSDVQLDLHRMYFSDALANFEDGSVDLIHIDGFHSYEAAKEDFETWLPKLSENGLVVMHDASRVLGYGSAEFCEEVTAKFDGFIFPHSCGLAVVAPKGNAGWESLFTQDSIDQKLLYYPHRAQSFLATLQTIDQARMIDDRDEVIRSQSEVIDDRDEVIAELQRSVEAKTAAMAKKQSTIEELKAKLKVQQTSPRAALNVLVTQGPKSIKTRIRR